MRRLGLLLLFLALAGGGAAAALLLTQEDEPADVAPTGATKPVLGRGGNDEAAAAGLGFPSFATKNTVRVGGADAIANAAAIAQAVYPSRADDNRPPALVLVDARDWQAAISAAQLMAPPVRAPILFTDGDELPEATEAALDRMRPTGSPSLADAQVVRIGDAAAPPGLDATEVKDGEPAEVAGRIDELAISAARRPTQSVVIASADDPAYAMPAAGWAAKSGDPVLWVSGDSIPEATRRAIIEHRRPRIYVLGSKEVVSAAVVKDLEKLSPQVRRIEGEDPVQAAIAFARFSDGRFGWNVVDPGHGMVFASARRTLDAAAAAPLSSTAQYGPLLLLPEANVLPEEVQDYLLDIQPGYDRDPVRGVYNHGWVIGDDSAVSVDVQARLDTLLEIQPVSTEETP